MQSGEWMVIDSQTYQLGAVLSTGAGSYGQVWAATDEAGRAVAIKFINTEIMTQADPSLHGHWREHLEREINFLRDLDADQSRHIVTLLHDGQVDGQPVLVLERLAANLGQWLAQRRRDNKPLPDLEQILDWARQILTGLDVIHNAGFIYRDLKFSNILVDERGEQLKLADFGSLKRENGDSTRSFIGTPATMAPEQALPVHFSPEGGEYAVDYRADYYALGLLLFSLLTRQPATAAQRRLGQLLAQHGQEGAARYGEQLGGLDDAERELLRQSIEFWTVPVLTPPDSSIAAQLTGLIDRLLARDPAERPQHSAEIYTVFNAVRLGQFEPPTLAPASSDALILGPDRDLPSPPSLPPNQRRRRASAVRHSPWSRRAAALVGVMGLAGALAWAIVIRPINHPPQSELIPDAVITTAPVPEPIPPAPVAALSVPAPASPAASSVPASASPAAPEAPDDSAEPVAHSTTEPATEAATEPVAGPASPPETQAVPVDEPTSLPEPVVDAAMPTQSNDEVLDQPTPVAVPPTIPAIMTPTAVERTPPARSKAVARSKPARTPAEATEPPSRPTPAVAIPEPKAPVAPPAPEITRSLPPRTVKNTPAPVRDKPRTPVRTQRTVRAIPSSPPATTRPTINAPTRSVARAEQRPRSAAAPLPPIRLESRQPPPTLPPINLISRTDPPPLTPPPARQARPTSAPDSPARAAPKKPTPRSTDPVTQLQGDAVRASSNIRRNVEDLTNWIGRTGASVGAEVQRGLHEADQTVTRWTRSRETQVERRDRWSQRYSGQPRRPSPSPTP